MQRPHGTDLPDIKFLHDNPYIDKMHMPDPNEKPRELLQQLDLAQDNKHTNEQNKDVAMDRSITCGRINLLRLRSYRTRTPNSEDDITPITDNTIQHMMDTDAASNATIEGTKVLHRLYSSVLLEEFTKDIENRICVWNTDIEQPITDEKTLNKKWHKLNLAIKEAAKKEPNMALWQEWERDYQPKDNIKEE
ncbi:4638_t:CDS:2, partial [Gigaspora margarita]